MDEGYYSTKGAQPEAEQARLQTTRLGLARLSLAVTNTETRRTVGAVFFTLAVVAVAQWRMLLQSVVPWSPDMLLHFYPLNTLTGEFLRAGSLPVWSVHQMSGMPLMADPQAGWGNVVSMLAYTLLPVGPATAWTISAQVALACVGTLLFLRSTGVSVSGSALAGLAYGVASTSVAPEIDIAYANFAYMGMVAWLPWLLLGADIAVRHRGRRRFLGWSLTAFAASQAVSSWLGQGAYYVFFATAAYVAFLVLAGPPAAGKRIITRVREFALHSIALAVLVGAWCAWSLLPRLELLSVSNLSGGYGAGEQQFSGGARPDVWQVIITSGEAYVGAATLLLFVTGLLLRPGRTEVFYAAMSFGLYLVSLRWLVEAVTASPLARGLVGLVPGALELHLHYPQRVLPVSLFFACALAGMALDRLLHAWRFGLFRLAVVAVFAALVVLLVGASVAPSPTPFYVGLALSLVVLVAVWVARLPAQAAAWLFVVLTAGELLRSEAMSDRRLNTPDAYYQTPNVQASVKALRLPEGTGRFFGYHPSHIKRYGLRSRGYRQVSYQPIVNSLLVTTQATMYGLEDVQGYNPLHLQTYDRLLAIANDQRQNYRSAYILPRALDSPLLDMLSVRRILAPEGTDLPDKYRRLTTSDKVSVYENESAMPRAWTVHETLVTTDERALRLIDAGQLDPRTTAAVSRPLLGIEPARWPDEVRVASYEADEIRVEATMTSPGLLVLSELDYPAWKVRVDGAPAEVVRANGALRAVQVPAGSHTITWYYSSTPTTLGFVLSALTLIASFALLALRPLHGVWVKMRRDVGSARTPQGVLR